MTRSKLLILFALISVCSLEIAAQKTLVVEDVSKVTDVWPCADRKEMMAEFRCNKTMRLSFGSNYHAGDNIDILSVKEDSVGTTRVYSIVLPTEGEKGTMSLDRRVFTVYCDGFDPYEIRNFNFAPKTKKVYEVTDEYLKFDNPYYKALADGSALFMKGNYADALNHYKIAAGTPEYAADADNRDLIDRRIEVIGSIMSWRATADSAFQEKRYQDALDTYAKILSHNPSDESVAQTRLECARSFYADCTSTMKKANELFLNDHLDAARTLYQSVLNEGCAQSVEAQERVLMIDNMVRDRKTRAHYFTYEFDARTPIGFSIGKYPQRGWSGYFSLHTNGNAFEAMRGEPKLSLDPEVSLSAGWTHKIYPPVWFHFGPGYTGRGQYVLKKDAVDKSPDQLEKEDYTFKWHNAISPEVGLAFKMWYITVRYTFQYRFALKSDSQGRMGRIRNYIGIGFDW